MTKRKKKNDLSLKQAKKLFKYENGRLFWKVKVMFSKNCIGDKVSCNSRLIPTVLISGQKYQLHRIVYLLHHGFCPERLDFINKTLTSEGSYDIAINNLFEPPKKIVIQKPKNNYREEISYFEANAYLEYKNGRLYWKEKPERTSRVVVGNLAGGISKNSPYPRITLYKKGYKQHRIVFLLHHRYCPEIVAVIDKTLTDEGVYNISIENLKEVTISHARNTSNTRIGNTSKYRGVSYDKEDGKYRARLSVNGVRKQYGKYDNEVEAAKRYDEIARKLIGEEAILNFPEEKPLSTSNP